MRIHPTPRRQKGKGKFPDEDEQKGGAVEELVDGKGHGQPGGKEKGGTAQNQNGWKGRNVGWAEDSWQDWEPRKWGKQEKRDGEEENGNWKEQDWETGGWNLQDWEKGRRRTKKLETGELKQRQDMGSIRMEASRRREEWEQLADDRRRTQRKGSRKEE